jgi:hypothetical protein
MPGFVATIANQVFCAHFPGTGQLAPFPARVLVMGQPVVPLSAIYSIKGCNLPAATSGGSPACVAGVFTKGATRVLVFNNGGPSPPVLVPTTGQCTPPDGTPRPLIAPPAGQSRVFAS